MGSAAMMDDAYLTDGCVMVMMIALMERMNRIVLQVCKDWNWKSACIVLCVCTTIAMPIVEGACHLTIICSQSIIVMQILKTININK